MSLVSGLLPPALKNAVLTSLLKKPNLDHEVLRNFRSISNLKVISKVIEKVVAVRLQAYLDSYQLTEPLQSAYKPFHSCETALVRVHNNILLAIDNRHCVMLLLLDLSAAFDNVDHEILLKRLNWKFSICGTTGSPDVLLVKLIYKQQYVCEVYTRKLNCKEIKIFIK